MAAAAALAAGLFLRRLIPDFEITFKPGEIIIKITGGILRYTEGPKESNIYHG